MARATDDEDAEEFEALEVGALELAEDAADPEPDSPAVARALRAGGVLLSRAGFTVHHGRR